MTTPQIECEAMNEKAFKIFPPKTTMPKDYDEKGIVICVKKCPYGKAGEEVFFAELDNGLAYICNSKGYRDIDENRLIDKTKTIQSY